MLMDVYNKHPKTVKTIATTSILAAGGTIAYIEWSKKNRKKIVKIAILGGKGCGKTELWYRLQDKERPSIEATNSDTIDEFILGKKDDGRIVTVTSTKDLGGGDGWVQNYKEIIKNGTLIYYLIDLTRLDDLKEETRARLHKILTIINENNLEDCHINILATFFDKYPSFKSEAVRDIDKIIFSEKINDVDFKGQSRPVNLLNDEDIKTIKDEIENSIDKKA